uniref:Retrovirus-related Pol polyprotein from transposon TNT 1-94 n=1 Tax=Tanacetum cinerariifolium TaxID=118510 RepID=A0A6L2JBK7_TANCI|nr:retrovirus-related Pol polyprotein from transposon TNT 1-94 [Tanacetum cinerariifolium]
MTLTYEVILIIPNKTPQLILVFRSPHRRCRRQPPSSKTKKKNITMAMISAFTKVDKMAHNSRKFAFTLSLTNYGYWKTMIEPFLITNNLMGYADGSIPCPSKTLSLTEGITSRDLWLSLEKVYAPHSTSTKYTLKTQLLRIEMHSDETPDAYLNRAQECDVWGLAPFPSNHGYRCLDILTERLYIARRSIFTALSDFISIISFTFELTSQTSLESSNDQSSPVSTTSIPTPPPPPPPITRQRPKNLRQNPKQRVPYIPSANHAIVLPITITEPTSFTVANNSTKWPQAIIEEHDALVKNGTWFLVPRASNTNVVDGKWAYRLKQDKNGAITRYKARFIAKGFDNNQIDVRNAFLHENIKEQVSMKPPGFIDPQRPNHVCLLHKSLYGLKQAPHAWFKRLFKALFDLMLKGSKTDPSLFIYSRGHAFLYMLVYVDDIIVTVKYQQVVGSLQYVTLSRPDIAFAVNKVYQYLHAPTENNWSAVKRILRYLHGNPDTSLEAFSDADWAGDSELCISLCRGT